MVASGKADMHIHSHFSDGDCSPQELVKRIKTAGLKAAVLTDHDDISAQKEFMDLCAKNGIAAMTGVEISATYEIPEYKFSDNVHILGYGFVLDYLNNEYGDYLKKNRLTTIFQVVEMMNKYNESGLFETSFDEMRKRLMVPNPFISRYWLARMRTFDLMNHSCDSLKIQDKREIDFRNAFKKASKEINEGGQFFIPRQSFILPEKAVEIINESLGLSVWAHPMKNFKKLKSIFGDSAEDIFEQIASSAAVSGLYGMEVYSSRHTKEDIEFLLKICEACDLCPNFGGSDYHGDRLNEHFPDRYFGSGGITLREFNEITNLIKEFNQELRN